IFGGHMKRRLAREMVVSSLFQIEFNDAAPEVALGHIIEEIMLDDEVSEKVSDSQTDDFARQLLFGVLENKLAIDELLVKYLKGWHGDRLSRVDRQILRLVVYEMIYQCEKVPQKIALNEAI